MTGDQAIYLMEKFKKEAMNDNKDSQQMKVGETMEKQKAGETMYFDPDVVRNILKEMVSFYDANGTLVGLNLESVLKGMTPKKMEQYFRLLEDYGFYTGGFDYFGFRDSALRGISTVAREFLEWSENEEIWNRAKAATEATKGASFKMFLRLLENQIGNKSCNIYWNLTQKENGDASGISSGVFGI